MLRRNVAIRFTHSLLRISTARLHCTQSFTFCSFTLSLLTTLFLLSHNTSGLDHSMTNSARFPGQPARAQVQPGQSGYGGLKSSLTMPTTRAQIDAISNPKMRDGTTRTIARSPAPSAYRGDVLNALTETRRPSPPRRSSPQAPEVGGSRNSRSLWLVLWPQPFQA